LAYDREEKPTGNPRAFFLLAPWAKAATKGSGWLWLWPRMFWPEFPVPVGVLRQVDRPTHSDLVDAQIEQAIVKSGPGDLVKTLHAGETWTVE